MTEEQCNVAKAKVAAFDRLRDVVANTKRQLDAVRDRRDNALWLSLNATGPTGKMDYAVVAVPLSADETRPFLAGLEAVLEDRLRCLADELESL